MPDDTVISPATWKETRQADPALGAVTFTADTSLTPVSTLI
jgi:hypothetical protein